MMLLVKQPCPTCRGKGLSEHPDWTDFYTHFKQEKKHIIDLQNGYTEQWFFNKGHLFLPPMKIPCDLCKGQGVVIGQLPLQDLAEMIKTTQQERTTCNLH